MFASAAFLPVALPTPNLSLVSSSSFLLPHQCAVPTLPWVSTKPFLTLVSGLLLTRCTHLHQNPHRRLTPARNSKSPPPSGEHDSLIKEAQEAVSRILRESGVSGQLSTEIAASSPKYLEMLMDGVRELDEHSLWSSWSREEELEGDPNLSYTKKVYCMAKGKGDEGMLPFLESIGLSLSSSMHLARFLSLETLPSLIHKVNYVKEMFFSGSDESGLIGRNARRMMMSLSVPVEDDVQQTLSFFEKIEARRGGLNMLGVNDAAFKYLVEAFPRLLLLSLESHVKPLVKYLEDIGVPRDCMKSVLLLFPPVIFCDIETGIKPRMMAFEKIGAMDKTFGKMLVKYPWILSTSIQENYEEILAFFSDEKVPKEYVTHAIKTWPMLLGSSTGKLNLIVTQFHELGIRNKKMGRVIARSPQLLLKRPCEFIEVVSFLGNLDIDKEMVGRILGRCPEIFAISIEKTLKKKIKFLDSIGVSRGHLPRIIRKYPEFFMSDIDKTVLPRMRLLYEAGLSQGDVAFMVRKFSPVLGYSIKGVLVPKLEFLVNTMGRPTKEVVEYPRYFSYSLERKIKPRFFVLKGRGVVCSLKDMLGMNDEEFAAQYMDLGRMLVPPSSP